MTPSAITSLLGIKKSLETFDISFTLLTLFFASLNFQFYCFIFDLSRFSILFLLLLLPKISEDDRGDISDSFFGRTLKLFSISSHLLSNSAVIIGRVEKPSIHSRFFHRFIHVHARGLINSLWSKGSTIGGRILDEKLFKFGANRWLILLRLMQ